MAFGATTELIAQARESLGLRQAAEPEVDLLPCNWHAWCVFQALATQWQVKALPRGRLLFVGLQYTCIPVANAGERPLLPPALRQPFPVLLRQLQVLEASALPVLNQPPPAAPGGAHDRRR